MVFEGRDFLIEAPDLVEFFVLENHAGIPPGLSEVHADAVVLVGGGVGWMGWLVGWWVGEWMGLLVGW